MSANIPLEVVTSHIAKSIKKAAMSAEILNDHRAFVESIIGIDDTSHENQLEKIKNMSMPEAIAVLEILTNIFYGVIPITDVARTHLKTYKPFINKVINRGSIQNKILTLKQNQSVVLQIVGVTKDPLFKLWNK
jgi:hypothetical protein